MLKNLHNNCFIHRSHKGHMYRLGLSVKCLLTTSKARRETSETTIYVDQHPKCLSSWLLRPDYQGTTRTFSLHRLPTIPRLHIYRENKGCTGYVEKLICLTAQDSDVAICQDYVSRQLTLTLTSEIWLGYRLYCSKHVALFFLQNV